MSKTDGGAPFSYDGLDRVIHEKARLGLLTSLMAGNGGLRYRVSGYVDVVGFGLGRIPVDERGRLGLPAPAQADSSAVL